MGKQRNNDGIGNFLIGLFGGAFIFAILSSFAKPKCPKCNQTIDRGIPECPNCKVKLGWK